MRHLHGEVPGDKGIQVYLAVADDCAQSEIDRAATCTPPTAQGGERNAQVGSSLRFRKEIGGHREHLAQTVTQGVRACRSLFSPEESAKSAARDHRRIKAHRRVHYVESNCNISLTGVAMRAAQGVGEILGAMGPSGKGRERARGWEGWLP